MPMPFSPSAGCGRTYLGAVPIALFALLPVVVACVALAFLWSSASRRARAAEARAKAADERLALVTAQAHRLEAEATTHRLNPHLFKNTLNTVQSFAYRTNWALERLGRLFDFMLYDSQARTVSLEEELAFLQDLIELNKLRLGPLFDLRIRIDVDTNDRWFRERLMAPLITAPFLENAFKHGDLDSDQGFIHIAVHLLDGRFHYEVHNRARHEDESGRKGGLGKPALEQRMKAMYPGRYELHYDDDGAGHRATMTIDLEAAHAALRAAG